MSDFLGVILRDSLELCGVPFFERKSIYSLKFNFLETSKPFVIDLFIHFHLARTGFTEFNWIAN